MDTASAIPKASTTPKRTPSVSQTPESNKERKTTHADVQSLLDLLDDAAADRSTTPDVTALKKQVKTLTASNTALASQLHDTEVQLHTRNNDISILHAQFSSLTSSHALTTITLHSRIDRQATTVKKQRNQINDLRMRNSQLEDFRAKHANQAQPVILRLLTNRNLKETLEMCREVAEQEAKREYTEFYGVDVEGDWRE
jgi:hypothetical protein